MNSSSRVAKHLLYWMIHVCRYVRLSVYFLFLFQQFYCSLSKLLNPGSHRAVCVVVRWPWPWSPSSWRTKIWSSCATPFWSSTRTRRTADKSGTDLLDGSVGRICWMMPQHSLKDHLSRDMPVSHPIPRYPDPASQYIPIYPNVPPDHHFFQHWNRTETRSNKKSSAHFTIFPPWSQGGSPARWPNGPMAWQDGTLSIEEIQKGIAESAVEIPGDLIEIMPLSQWCHGGLWWWLCREIVYI